MANDILVKIGADITDFSRKMSESNRALSNFGQANQQTFDAFKKTGAVVTGAGIALAGGLGFAVKKAAEFEGGMSKVAAISGATGKDLDALTDIAREMGAKTSFSATEAAEGLEYMALAGWDTNQMIGGLEPILHLAEAGALDLGRASDLVTDSMAAMGIQVDDLDGYLDKVASTASNANTDIDALMEAFVIAGGTFNRLNVPLEESNAFLGVLANRGFKGAEAGTAVNAIMSRLTKETGPAADALNDMGVAVFDNEGNFRGMEAVLMDVKNELDNMTDAERENALTLIAGLNHGKSFNAMLEGLGDEYGELKGKVENSNGALKEMRDIMKDNLQGALENLNSAFEEMMISIGEALLPAVKLLVSVLQWLLDKFNGLSGGMKSFIAISTAVVAGLALIVGPILLLIGFIPSIIAGFAALKTVFIAVGAAIGAISWPVVLIVGLLIGAVALIYAYWEPIKGFFIDLWEGIKVAGIAIWDWLKEVWASTVDFFIELWEGTVEFFTGLWDGVKEFFVELWDGIVETATTVWDVIKEAWLMAAEYLYEVFEPIIDFFIDTWESVNENATQAWDNFTEMISAVWEGIKTIASNIWEMIKIAIITPILVLIQMLTGDFEGAKSTLSQIWERIKGIAQSTWDALKSIVAAIVKGLITSISNSWNNAKSFLTGLWTAIKSTASNLWEGMKSALSSIVESTKTAISNKWNEIKTAVIEKATEIVTAARDKFEDVKEGIREKLTEAVTVVGEKIGEMPGKVMEFFGDMLNSGKMLVAGLINGIKNMAGKAIEAITGVVDGVVKKAKSLLNIKSPSRVFAEIGEFTGMGLVRGMDATKSAVERATERMTTAATPDIDMSYDTPSGIRSSLTSAVNGTVDVNSRDGALIGAIQELRRDMTNLRIEMDGKQVGEVVEPHVTKKQNTRIYARNKRR